MPEYCLTANGYVPCSPVSTTGTGNNVPASNLSAAATPEAGSVWDNKKVPTDLKNRVVGAFQEYYRRQGLSATEIEERFVNINNWALKDVAEWIKWIEKNRSEKAVEPLIGCLNALKALARLTAQNQLSDPSTASAIQNGEIEFFTPDSFVVKGSDRVWADGNKKVLEEQVVPAFRQYYAGDKESEKYLQNVRDWTAAKLIEWIRFIKKHKDSAAFKPLVAILPVLKQVLASRATIAEKLTREEQALLEAVKEANSSGVAADKLADYVVNKYIKTSVGLENRKATVEQARKELALYKLYSERQSEFFAHYTAVSKKLGNDPLAKQKEAQAENKKEVQPKILYDLRDDQAVAAWKSYMEAALNAEQRTELASATDEEVISYYYGRPSYKDQLNDYKKARSDQKGAEVVLATKKYWLENLKEMINNGAQYKQYSASEKQQLIKSNETRLKKEVAEAETRLTEAKNKVAAERQKALAYIESTDPEYQTLIRPRCYYAALWDLTRNGVKYLRPAEYGLPEKLEVFASVYGLNPQLFADWESGLKTLDESKDLLYGEYLMLSQVKGGGEPLSADGVRSAVRSKPIEIRARIYEGKYQLEDWQKLDPAVKSAVARLIGEESKLIAVSGGDNGKTKMVVALKNGEAVSNGYEDRYLKDGRLYRRSESMLNVSGWFDAEVPGSDWSDLDFSGLKDTQTVPGLINEYWAIPLDNVQQYAIIPAGDLYEKGAEPVYVSSVTGEGSEVKNEYAPISGSQYAAQEGVIRQAVNALGKLNKGTLSGQGALAANDSWLRKTMGVKSWDPPKVEALSDRLGIEDGQARQSLAAVLLGHAQLVVQGELQGEKIGEARFFLVSESGGRMIELPGESAAHQAFVKVLTLFSAGQNPQELDRTGNAVLSYSFQVPVLAGKIFKQNLAFKIATLLQSVGANGRDPVQNWEEKDRILFFQGLVSVLTSFSALENRGDSAAFSRAVNQWILSQKDSLQGKLNAQKTLKIKNDRGEEKEIKERLEKLDSMQEIYLRLGVALSEEKALEQFKGLDKNLADQDAQEFGQMVLNYLSLPNLNGLKKRDLRIDSVESPQVSGSKKTNYYVFDSTVLGAMCDAVDVSENAAAVTGESGTWDSAVGLIDQRSVSIDEMTSHYAWVYQHPGAVASLYFQFQEKVAGYKAFKVDEHSNRVVVKTNITADDLLLLAGMERGKAQFEKAAELEKAAAVMRKAGLYLGEEVLQGDPLNESAVRAELRKNQSNEKDDFALLKKTADYLRNWYDTISRNTSPVAGIMMEEIVMEQFKRPVERSYWGEAAEAAMSIPAPAYTAKRMQMIEGDKILALKEILFPEEIAALRQGRKLPGGHDAAYFRGEQMGYIDGEFIIRFVNKFGHLTEQSQLNLLLTGESEEELKNESGEAINSPRELLVRYGQKLKDQDKVSKMALDPSTDSVLDHNGKLTLQGAFSLWQRGTWKDHAGRLQREGMDIKTFGLGQVLGMDDTQIDYPLRFKTTLLRWGYKGDVTLSDDTITADQIRYAGLNFRKIWNDVADETKAELIKAFQKRYPGINASRLENFIVRMEESKQGVGSLDFRSQTWQGNSLEDALVFFVRMIVPNFAPPLEGEAGSNIVDLGLHLTGLAKGKSLAFGAVSRDRAGAVYRKAATKDWYEQLSPASLKELPLSAAGQVKKFIAKGMHLSLFMHPSIQLSLQAGLIARVAYFAQSGDTQYAKDAVVELIKLRLGFLAFQYNPMALFRSGLMNAEQGAVATGLMDMIFMGDAARNLSGKNKGGSKLVLAALLIYSSADKLGKGRLKDGVAEGLMGLGLAWSQWAMVKGMIGKLLGIKQWAQLSAEIEAGLPNKVLSKELIKELPTEELRNLKFTARRAGSTIKDVLFEPFSKAIQTWQRKFGKIPVFWQNMILCSKNPIEVFTLKGGVKVRGIDLIRLYRLGIDPTLLSRAAHPLGLESISFNKIQVGASTWLQEGEISNIRQTLRALNPELPAAQIDSFIQLCMSEAQAVRHSSGAGDGMALKLFKGLWATDIERFWMRDLYNTTDRSLGMMEITEADIKKIQESNPTVADELSFTLELEGAQGEKSIPRRLLRLGPKVTRVYLNGSFAEVNLEKRQAFKNALENAKARGLKSLTIEQGINFAGDESGKWLDWLTERLNTKNTSGGIIVALDKANSALVLERDNGVDKNGNKKLKILDLLSVQPATEPEKPVSAASVNETPAPEGTIEISDAVKTEETIENYDEYRRLIDRVKNKKLSPQQAAEQIFRAGGKDLPPSQVGQIFASAGESSEDLKQTEKLLREYQRKGLPKVLDVEVELKKTVKSVRLNGAFNDVPEELKSKFIEAVKKTRLKKIIIDDKVNFGNGGGEALKNIIAALGNENGMGGVSDLNVSVTPGETDNIEYKFEARRGGFIDGRNKMQNVAGRNGGTTTAETDLQQGLNEASRVIKSPATAEKLVAFLQSEKGKAFLESPQGKYCLEEMKAAASPRTGYQELKLTAPNLIIGLVAAIGMEKFFEIIGLKDKRARFVLSLGIFHYVNELSGPVVAARVLGPQAAQAMKFLKYAENATRFGRAVAGAKNLIGGFGEMTFVSLVYNGVLDRLNVSNPILRSQIANLAVSTVTPVAAKFGYRWLAKKAAEKGLIRLGLETMGKYASGIGEANLFFDVLPGVYYSDYELSVARRVFEATQVARIRAGNLWAADAFIQQMFHPIAETALDMAACWDFPEITSKVIAQDIAANRLERQKLAAELKLFVQNGGDLSVLTTKIEWGEISAAGGAKIDEEKVIEYAFECQKNDHGVEFGSPEHVLAILKKYDRLSAADVARLFEKAVRMNWQVRLGQQRQIQPAKFNAFKGSIVNDDLRSWTTDDGVVRKEQLAVFTAYFVNNSQ